MTCNSIINSAGLILDIVGALMLLKFGIPNKIDPEGSMVIEWDQKDEAEIRRARIYRRWSNTAIVLIFLGFFLQLISNFLQS